MLNVIGDQTAGQMDRKKIENMPNFCLLLIRRGFLTAEQGLEACGAEHKEEEGPADCQTDHQVSQRPIVTLYLYSKQNLVSFFWLFWCVWSIWSVFTHIM